MDKSHPVGKMFIPVDTGLNWTYIRRSGRFLNVLRTFNLHPVSTGMSNLKWYRKISMFPSFHLLSWESSGSWKRNPVEKNIDNWFWRAGIWFTCCWNHEFLNTWLVIGQNHIGAGLIWLQLQVLEQTTIQLLSAKFVQKAACLCK